MLKNSGSMSSAVPHNAPKHEGSSAAFLRLSPDMLASICSLHPQGYYDSKTTSTQPSLLKGKFAPTQAAPMSAAAVAAEHMLTLSDAHNSRGLSHSYTLFEIEFKDVEQEAFFYSEAALLAINMLHFMVCPCSCNHYAAPANVRIAQPSFITPCLLFFAALSQRIPPSVNASAISIAAVLCLLAACITNVAFTAGVTGNGISHSLCHFLLCALILQLLSHGLLSLFPSYTSMPRAACGFCTGTAPKLPCITNEIKTIHVVPAVANRQICTGTCCMQGPLPEDCT